MEECKFQFGWERWNCPESALQLSTHNRLRSGECTFTCQHQHPRPGRPLGTSWDALWRELGLLMEQGCGIPKITVVFSLSVLSGGINSASVFPGTPGSSWISVHASLELGPPHSGLRGLAPAAVCAASQGVQCCRHLSLQWREVRGDKGRNQRWALRNWLHKNVADKFPYSLLQQAGISFFPEQHLYLNLLRKPKEKLDEQCGCGQLLAQVQRLTETRSMRIFPSKRDQSRNIPPPTPSREGQR